MIDKPTYEELERSVKALEIESDARKKAEEKLKKSESFLKSIIDQNPFPIWISDPDGVMVRANPALLKALNLTKEQLVGRYNVFHDPQVEQQGLTSMIRDTLEKGTTTDYELDWVGDDTSIDDIKGSNRVYCVGTIFPVKDGEGNITNAIITYRDASEQKQVEEALRERTEIFNRLMKSYPGVAYVIDADGYYLFDEGKGLEKVGLKPNQVVEERWNAFEVYKEDKDMINAMKAALKGEITYLTVFQHDHYWDLWFGPYTDEKGNITGILGTADDVTDRKQADKALRESEERLQQSQKMESIGNLAGGIAHDFNNILFPIVGMTELLLEDLSPDSLEYQNAKQILKAGKRGSELVQQILAFSRGAEHKKLPMRVQQIMKEVLKLTRSTIPSNIEITEMIQGDCGFVMGDATQIHQIAMNLITNAYHAVENTGGGISIHLREEKPAPGDLKKTFLKPGPYVILSVSDTGCGMGPDMLDKIFDPYFTTKEQGKGTGLGLAVVYGIIKEHGGEIRVKSEPGKGSTFDVYFPLLEALDKSESSEIPQPHPTGTERILLVDDEEAVVLLERQMLERLGYKVTDFSNSGDALKAFEANPDAFDLVITDMAMPNITGIQLAETLFSVRRDIPVIICTGFSERLNVQTAEKLGISGLLKKPVSKMDMAGMIRKVLEEAVGVGRRKKDDGDNQSLPVQAKKQGGC